MLLYRFAGNPYKPSTWNSRANNIDTRGKSGVFCFDPTRPAMRCFGSDTVEEEVSYKYLTEQFGDVAFGGTLHAIDVDDSEIVSRGYGRYANVFSDDWDDYTYIPECFVAFGEF